MHVVVATYSASAYPDKDYEVAAVAGRKPDREERTAFTKAHPMLTRTVEWDCYQLEEAIRIARALKTVHGVRIEPIR